MSAGAYYLGGMKRFGVLFQSSVTRVAPDYYAFGLQLTEAAGIGCIVRVMTDRRTV